MFLGLYFLEMTTHQDVGQAPSTKYNKETEKTGYFFLWIYG